MTRYLLLTLFGFLFISTGQAKSAVINTISCYNSNNSYEKFNTYLYEGNQEAKYYEGDVYGKQTYILTHRTINDDLVAETYTLLFSNVTPSPEKFELKYSLSDYKHNPQGFTIKSNKRREDTFICNVKN